MAVKYKYFIPNQTYFITFTILGWKNIFTNDKYCNLIYKWFDYMRKNYRNEIYGYVIMPNHTHVLIKITDKSPKPSILIGNAKRFLAYQIINFLEQDNKKEILDHFKKYARIKEKAKHKVFEDRYDLLPIPSHKIFLEKLNYIHNNPLSKHWRLAEDIVDYKYSSAANYERGEGHYEINMTEF